MFKIPIRKESSSHIWILSGVSLIMFFILPVMAIIPIILLLFVMFIFRSFEINISMNEKTFLYSVNNKIIYVIYRLGKYLRVFNIHISKVNLKNSIGVVK
jgi:phosphatidylserine decarboxylase